MCLILYGTRAVFNTASAFTEQPWTRKIVRQSLHLSYIVSYKNIQSIQQNRHILCFISCILPCQNPPPTLPTMQPNHQRFGCVLLVAANVALLASSKEEEQAYSLHPETTYSNTQISHSTSWNHKRVYVTFSRVFPCRASACFHITILCISLEWMCVQYIS